MGEGQKNLGVLLPASCPSPSVLDVAENLRAKIHALFMKIGLDKLEGLSYENKVTCQLIIGYLDLKVKS